MVESTGDILPFGAPGAYWDIPRDELAGKLGNVYLLDLDKTEGLVSVSDRLGNSMTFSEEKTASKSAMAPTSPTSEMARGASNAS